MQIKVKLTPNEVAFARVCGVSPSEYAHAALRMLQEKALGLHRQQKRKRPKAGKVRRRTTR
jgi:hypothetical protein